MPVHPAHTLSAVLHVLWTPVREARAATCIAHLCALSRFTQVAYIAQDCPAGLLRKFPFFIAVYLPLTSGAQGRHRQPPAHLPPPPSPTDRQHLSVPAKSTATGASSLLLCHATPTVVLHGARRVTQHGTGSALKRTDGAEVRGRIALRCIALRQVYTECTACPPPSIYSAAAVPKCERARVRPSVHPTVTQPGTTPGLRGHNWGVRL